MSSGNVTRGDILDMFVRQDRVKKIIEKIILAPETCNKCDNMIPHYYYFVRRYLYLHSLFGINQCLVKVILLFIEDEKMKNVQIPSRKFYRATAPSSAP